MTFWCRLKCHVSAFLGAHLISFVMLFVVFGALVETRSSDGPGASLPLFINPAASGTAQVTETLLFSRGVMVLAGEFGVDRAGRAIIDEVVTRMPFSLMLTGVPLLVVLLVASFVAAGWATIALMSSARWRRAGLPIALFAAFACGFWPAQWLVEAMWRFVLAEQLAEQGARIVLAVSLTLGMAGGWWWVTRGWAPLWCGAAARTGLLLGLDRKTVLLGVLPGALRRGSGAVAGVVGVLFAVSLLLETIFEVRGLGRYAVEAFHASDVAALQVLVLIGVALYMIVRSLAGGRSSGVPVTASGNAWRLDG